MSQSWGSPPSHPSPRSSQSQYPLSKEVIDYYPGGDTPIKRASYFFAGSCTILILVGCCLCVAATLWVLDNRFDMLIDALESNNPGGQSAPAFPGGGNAPVFVPTPPLVPTPTPSPIVQQPLSTATPAGPKLPVPIGQPVLANDVGLELTVFDIQHNVQPVNLKAANGLEFAAVSVQLRNTQSGTARSYQVLNFELQDVEGNPFPPDLEADNGRRLENGEVPPNTAIEGDLLFHIPLGLAPLTLVWQSTDSAEIYTVALQ